MRSLDKCMKIVTQAGDHIHVDVARRIRVPRELFRY